jgi:glycosyl transferase family 25
MTLADRIFASFDRIYILNLLERADRRTEMAGELARLGTGFDDPHIRLYPAIRPADAGGFAGIGEHGAFLTHLGVLREARDLGCHTILILEDDCDFAAGIEELFPPALDMLDTLGLDIFYGGYLLPEGLGDADPQATPLLLADRTAPLQMAHFIGFGRNAIESLVPYLEAMIDRPPGSSQGGPMPVDGAYNWFRASRPDLTTWLARPRLGHQRPSRSDIAPPGLLDRLPGPMRDVARGIRRRWQRRARQP